MNLLKSVVIFSALFSGTAFAQNFELYEVYLQNSQHPFLLTVERSVPGEKLITLSTARDGDRNVRYYPVDRLVAVRVVQQPSEYAFMCNTDRFQVLEVLQAVRNPPIPFTQGDLIQFDGCIGSGWESGTLSVGRWNYIYQTQR